MLLTTLEGRCQQLPKPPRQLWCGGFLV